MKVLIGQPVHEEGIVQLKKDIVIGKKKNIDIVLYPEGYLSNEKNLGDACNLAKENNIVIITSYRKNNKDIGAIISNTGEIILERDKTSSDEKEELNVPLYVNFDGVNIGYLLCMEILKGMRDLKKLEVDIDFVSHPIGVGMFSDAQFEQWVNEAKVIAKTYKTIIIGTSHADGSYRNCGTSIPISYCIDRDGKSIYIAKCDTRARIVNLHTYEYEIV